MTVYFQLQVFLSSFSTAPIHILDSPQKDSGTEEEEEDEEEEDGFESDATDNSSGKSHAKDKLN